MEERAEKRMKYTIGDVVKVVKPYHCFGHLGEVGRVHHFDDSGKNFFIDFGDVRSGWWTSSCVEHFSDNCSIDDISEELNQYASIVNELNGKLSKLILMYNKEVRKNRKDEDNEKEEGEENDI